MMFSLVVECLVGKDVVVSVDGVEIKGHLVHYSPSQRYPSHAPEALILRDENNRFLILKTWKKVELI